MPAPIAYDAPLHPADRKMPSASTRSLVCHRCKAQRSTIKLQTALFCRPCFLYHFESKLRTAMEQVKVCAYIVRIEGETEQHAKGGDATSMESLSLKTSTATASTSAQSSRGRVALGLSGGSSSVALLHMARRRLLPPLNYERQTGKTFEVFGVDVVHIDDGALFEGGSDRIATIRQIVDDAGGAAAGFNLVIVRIEDVFDEGRGAQCSMQPNGDRTLDGDTCAVSDTRQALLSLFAALKSDGLPRGMLANARSKVEDLHHLFISHLLRREATRRGARCLLTGETATRRAVRVVDGISRGRGYKLPLEEASVRWRDLFMLQPMAECTAKEVAYFLHTQNVQTLQPRELVSTDLLHTNDTGKGDKASMRRLTESFIYLLESNVPGTVSTVNGTNSKLIYTEQSASHGLEGGTYATSDIQGPQVASFDKVGPTLPLRFRQRNASNGTALASEVSSDVRNQADVRGMGLGGLGAKLYFTAKSFPQTDDSHACPLCQMPAQRGLDMWKRGLTVDKVKRQDAAIIPILGQDQATDDALPKGGASITLDTLLCYACSILLTTPETTSPETTVLLPSYILKGAEDRLRDASQSCDDAEFNQTNGSDDTLGRPPRASALLETQAASSKRQQEAAQVRRVAPEEMRRQVHHFLLDDREGASQDVANVRQKRDSVQADKAIAGSSRDPAHASVRSTQW